MIRKGIPAPLRCAVWLSNIIQASHPHQELKYAHAYRTLAKVRVLDHGYQFLWDNSVKIEDIEQVSFGHDGIWKQVADYPGKESLERVLFALSNVLGVVEFAPLVPSIAAILLGFMGESYVFCAIREMAHNSTWYWAASKSEHIAYGRAFLDILGKLHPHSAQTLKEKGVEEQTTQAIFQDFFQTILDETQVLRTMDIYTFEGTKVLFRFGVALVVLYQREWKEHYVYELETSWWDGLQEYAKTKLSFDLLAKKAYGVHGKGVRKRYRFPRRPILARIIQLEEERYWNDNRDSMESDVLQVQPLGLVEATQPDDPDKEPIVPKLSESTLVRKKLAEWLPLSLRYTKLDLLYSTNHHGRTLESFYRNVSKARHTIMLIEPISTSEKMVVGMYAPQTWHASTKIYGDGSCFLFRILEDKPDESNCWKWHPKELLEEEGDDSIGGNSDNATALLEQFQVGTREFISMGGNKDGTSGLRLNEDLTKAESASAAGFDNLPLAGDMFEVGLVEVYQMVRQMDGMAVH
jgi:hypothetical protein